MKPHEETWTFADRGANPAAGARLYSDNHEEEWATTWGEDSRGRARLAAQAPAMARLLVSLGAMDVHDGAGHTGVYVCSWCDAESKNVEAVPHLHDCRLVTVLKAAGVIE